MSETYLTAAAYGEAEYVDKKSRFIGHVQPVKDEAEAKAFLEDIRALHADATHNVWAYVLRNGVMRWSDDGEPGGTSGQPTLNVFRSENVVDVCCVTTRYFGGILLGSGGLVRAYSAAARAGLDAAGVARMEPWQRCALRCSYAQYEILKRFLSDRGARVEETSFGADVEILYTAAQGLSEGLARSIYDKTAGTVEPIPGETVFRPVLVER